MDAEQATGNDSVRYESLADALRSVRRIGARIPSGAKARTLLEPKPISFATKARLLSGLRPIAFETEACTLLGLTPKAFETRVRTLRD